MRDRTNGPPSTTMSLAYWGIGNELRRRDHSKDAMLRFLADAAEPAACSIQPQRGAALRLGLQKVSLVLSTEHSVIHRGHGQGPMHKLYNSN